MANKVKLPQERPGNEYLPTKWCGNSSNHVKHRWNCDHMWSWCEGLYDMSTTSTTGNEMDPEGVDHPVHYNVDPSGVECIEITRHRNFNVGNAIKYLWRAGLKGNPDSIEDQIKDLKKTIWYTEDEIKKLETLANS